MKKQKRIASGFLYPTLIIIFITTVAAILLISSYIENNIEEQSKEQALSRIELVRENIDLAHTLVMDKVRAGMRVLREEGNSLGNPSISGTAVLNGKSVPNLSLGGVSQVGRYDVVDKAKELVEGTATLFVKSGVEFIRVSTNVQKEDGSRAIGTVLNPEGRAYEKIMSYQAYYGLVDILGKPYLTAYEPMFDNSGELVGIWYVGYRLSTLEKLKEIINATHILENGFLTLIDNKDKIVFKSEQSNEDLVTEVVKAATDDEWTVFSEEYDNWGYKIVCAYPQGDITGIVNDARFVVILFGLFILGIIAFVIYFSLKRIILSPVRKLDTAARKMVAGDYDVEIKDLD